MGVIRLRLLQWMLLITGLLVQLQALAEPPSSALTGSVFEYPVQSGDSLTKIGARFGVSAKVLARENELAYQAKLSPNQWLTIDNRHIVPTSRTGDLLINLPQRMLFSFENGELLGAYPVGLGKPSWETPLGEFSINNKVMNKTWLVPKSIQNEMRHDGKAVLTQVPPGPKNPLGKHWLGLSLAGIGIHGTITPASIYQFQSHGCIRMHPDDIEALFEQTELGTIGEIIYEPLLLAEHDNKIFIEVHPDIYRLNNKVSMKTLEKMAQETMLSERIDWLLAKTVLELQDGVARDVTLSSGTH